MPMPPTVRGPEVGDDVAEHVLGHHHVVEVRTLDHVRRHRVYYRVVRLDIGICGGDLREDPAEERVASQHVRLVAQCDPSLAVPQRAIALARELEGLSSRYAPRLCA